MLSVLEGRDIGSFVGSFGGAYGDGYVVGGTCVGLGVGGITTSSEVDAIQLNDSSPFSCKSKI